MGSESSRLEVRPVSRKEGGSRGKGIFRDDNHGRNPTTQGRFFLRRYDDDTTTTQDRRGKPPLGSAPLAHFLFFFEEKQTTPRPSLAAAQGHRIDRGVATKIKVG